MKSERSLWQRTELALFGVGAACALLCSAVAVVSATTAADLHLGRGASRSILQTPSPTAGGPVVVSSEVHVDASSFVMGKLEIPALSLSVPIISDYRTTSLLKGVGHVPGTAMPGGLGTLGLAGHRDTYFRPLRNIKRNMDIRVSSSEGAYHYLVDSTEIVDPDNVAVLDIKGQPELTLITCYPFYYVGAAPMRFIVHAHLRSALPE